MTVNRQAFIRWAGLIAAVAFAGNAQAIVLRFDDLPAFSTVSEGYAALGVHFSTGDAEIERGIANGDPGGWGLNGTNGPYFDAFNGFPSYSMTITLDSPVSNFSLDVSRSNGSSPGDTFTISVFHGLTLLQSQTIGLGPINSWSSITLPVSGINRVVWSGSGSGFHPYGIDNIQLGVVPEPSTILLLGLGGLLLRRVVRRHPTEHAAQVGEGFW